MAKLVRFELVKWLNHCLIAKRFRIQTLVRTFMFLVMWNPFSSGDADFLTQRILTIALQY